MPDETPPFPIVEVAIEPNSEADHERLAAALAELAAEDTSFQFSRDQESGQTIMKGASESHLEDRLDRLVQAYRIDARIGAPQVAFRERATERVDHVYTHKRQSGGKSQFASIRLVVEPNEPDSGYVFRAQIAEGALPSEYLQGVEKGIEGVLTSGVVAGFPVVDVKVSLVDAKYHSVDSSALAFEIAARACFREALQKAKSILLEPIMKVEVITPDDHARFILSDLCRRRAQIAHRDTRNNALIIDAMVPLMNMFGYAKDLRAMSAGSATFTMRFDHYAVAPPMDSGDHPPFRPAIGMRA